MQIIQTWLYKFERWIVSRSSWDYIPGSDLKLFYIDLQKYRGQTLALPGGKEIKSGDIIGELHINNLKVKDMQLKLKDIFNYLNSELDSLAAAARDNPRLQMVSAFYGRSVLCSMVAHQGFTIMEINSPVKKIFLLFWENILKSVYTGGNKKFKLRSPRECWITRERLIQRLEINSLHEKK